MAKPKVDRVGNKRWYNNTRQYHRSDGPACIFTNGTNYWYQNNKRHRVDGPAAEFKNGTKYWYQNGKTHRLDGPAMEHADGTSSYCINGQLLTKDEWNVHPLRKDYIIKENLKSILHD